MIRRRGDTDGEERERLPNCREPPPNVSAHLKFDLFFLFIKVTLLQFRLAQNRPECAITNLFAMNWNNGRKSWIAFFAILGMRASLGNKKEALFLKDFYNDSQWIGPRHVEV